MKRLATKIMLSPAKLTKGEKRMIHRFRTIPRNLRFMNKTLKNNFFQGPLGPREEVWRGVFQVVRSKYRSSICQEDSFSLCFEALRKSILKDKHYEPGYLYRTCENAHKDFLKINLVKSASAELSVDADALVDWEGLDFALDLEEALKQASIGSIDVSICKMRFLEMLTYEDIGAAIGMSRMGAWKRFQICCTKISRFLAVYGCKLDSIPRYVEQRKAA